MYYNLGINLVLMAASMVGLAFNWDNVLVVVLSSFFLAFGVNFGFECSFMGKRMDCQQENLYNSRFKTWWMRLTHRSIYTRKGLYKALMRETAKPGSIRVGTRIPRALATALVQDVMHQEPERYYGKMKHWEVMEMLKNSKFVPRLAYVNAALHHYSHVYKRKRAFVYQEEAEILLLSDELVGISLSENINIFRPGPESLADVAKKSSSELVRSVVAIAEKDLRLAAHWAVPLESLGDASVHDSFRSLIEDCDTLTPEDVENLFNISRAL